MPTPTEQEIFYDDWYATQIDWYQNTSGTPPAGGKPWILITNSEGFRSGGRLAARDRDPFRGVIEFFIDNFVSNGLSVPFDFFVSEGRQDTFEDAETSRTYFKRHSTQEFFPVNVYDHAHAYQFIRATINDRPSRFPNLNADQGGVWGWSSGGTVAQWIAFAPSRPVLSGGSRRSRYTRAASSKPAFLVNFSGANDYRSGAFAVGAQNNTSYLGITNGDPQLDSMPQERIAWASPQTHIDSTAPPTYSIYDNVGGSRPATFAHDRVQGEEVHAALQALSIESQSVLTDTDGVLSAGELTAIYNWIIGPTVLDL